MYAPNHYFIEPEHWNTIEPVFEYSDEDIPFDPYYDEAA